MLRSVVWHNSSERHSQIELTRANAILNDQEYESGAVVMRSVPPYLHFSMEARCNIANDQPCVYCPWKFVKREELGSPTSDLPFIKSLDTYWSDRWKGDRLQYRRTDPASRICENCRFDCH